MDTPVLVAGSRRGAARLGETGALPDALVSIFDQVGAMVVVIRVADGSDNSDTRANVIGGVGADTDAYTVPYPAEHITFRSMMTDGYMEELTTRNRLPPSAKRPGALAVATLRADNLPDDGIAPSPAEIRYPHRYPLCYPPRTDF
ncbi:hypothetical protein [Fodinicurvata sp. EGI_FJ10296]|uniref:hypothetical protein n=1 Tax=Fodinicurvata sp. EGI_FJ10296 TaxID=3231908 RepID=UPI003453EB25